ncbi:MAG: hypothetical protein AB1461_15125 [Thermodesulfobacteriota bacterium]
MFCKSKQTCVIGFLSILSLFLFLTGCTNYSGGGSQQDYAAPSQPYYPPDFREILIPDGLEMNREDSMFVKTTSFNGGVLTFEGRVDVISLSDFFEGSMPKNGWKQSGVVKAKNYLLIFTKPDRTCMITISENKLNFKTVVNIYIAQDTDSLGGGAESSGGGEENFSVAPLE